MLARRNTLRFPLGLTFAVLGNWMFVAPARAADAPPAKVAESKPAAAQNNAELQFHILAGELAAGRNQPGVAAQEFLQAVNISPNAELIARATNLALAANNAELALAAARKWLLIEGSSLEAREVITRLSLRLGLDDDAYAQCTAIVRDHPGGKDDGFRHVALLLSQEGNSGPAALALMARLAAQYPKLAGAWQAQSLLALRFNDLDTAEKSAREALRLQPNSREVPLLLMGALVRKGDVTAAEQIVETQIRTSPEPAELRLAFARLLLESDQRDRAREQLQKVLKIEVDNADAHFLLGLLALEERRLDDAEAHLLPLTKGSDREIDAQYYLGRIAEIRGQPMQALNHYEKVVSGNQALDAAVRRAAMLAKLGHLPDARTTLEQLREQYPPLATRFYLAEGEILVDTGELDDAIDVYTTALTGNEEDPELRYARALVHERLNHIDAAETDLHAVLARTPNDARALNALGFMLIVHTTRLSEAEKLINHALELTPDEPAVIDSLGWLRFRQGRSTEAVNLLARAYDRFPDPEVAAHLGEALWTSGEHGKAQVVWNRALESAPDSAVLRETVKRLNP